MRFILVSICIATIQIVVHSKERDVTIFGEERSGSYFATSKHKYAIPFTTRSTEVAFPDVSTLFLSTKILVMKNLIFAKDFTSDKLKNLTSNQIVRGIRHYNDVKDPDCKPELEISKGGINQYFATLSIKSKKGCSIDSTVGFITERI